MNYFYTFKKDFFRNFHSNLNREQALAILDFTRKNFLEKENFYLQMDRSLLDIKFGEGEVNDIYNKLRKDISNRIINSYNFRKLPIDFTFTGNNKKILFSNDILFNELNCDFIKKHKNKIEKKISRKCVNYWIGSKKQTSKRLLADYLKRITISCDKIYFIDRMIAAIAVNGKDYQYKSYKITFEFLYSFFKTNKNEYNLISSVSSKQKENIDIMTKEKFFNNLNLLLNKVVDKKNNLLIKERAHNAFHQRYMIVFLEDDLLAMYQLSEGNLIDGDKVSTNERKIDRKQKMQADELWNLMKDKVVQKANIYAVYP